MIISFIAYSIYLYQNISNGKVTDFTGTEQRVNQELELSTIDQISRYHGTDYFHVVEGQTTDQEDVMIFVNQSDQEADLIVFSKGEWVTEAQIIDNWEEQTSYQKKYQTQYGIRNGTPLMEIVYLDQNGRLSYDYYRLDNGEYDSGISFANKSK
ncbi:cell wall elongation regulator TseB-like domain-containing protein [Amphibacillus sp. Q70]|uniref:cell wall elongation regulator TseB-like domain-containing protein n=1 Tax=Amphibacillus sp. Q70 TaxID=3453416 RepID=UPI003F85AE4D